MNSPGKDQRSTLAFESEPGASRSKWVSGALAAALALWMASGFVFPAEEAREETAGQKAVEAVAVAVRESEARAITQLFTAEGQAEPDRRTAVRAEASGTVRELAADKGAWLEQDALIARLDTREPTAQLERAQEEYLRARREFDNAQTLLERGVATVDRVAAARATLAAAEAAVTRAEEALGNAEIRAPFAGRLDALSIDKGEFVQAGTQVGTVLDSHPLTVAIRVPQQAIARIEAGQPATVTFITGQERAGTVRFVGADADPQTRTFRAEIEVANPEGDLAAGLSAQVRIPTGELKAHFISPAILSLGTDGQLGVKAVDADSRVVFHPVTVERAGTEGIWVSGLPDRLRLITVGQGFVSGGEAVRPRPAQGALAPQAAPAGEAAQ